jgi:hypothetical protein
MTMNLRDGLVLATLGLFASCGVSAQQASGTSGEPAQDVKRDGVVNETSGERPREEMNPHPDYPNTDRKGDRAPVYAPGTDMAPRDGAAGPQKSGETATTPRPMPQR